MAVRNRALALLALATGCARASEAPREIQPERVLAHARVLAGTIGARPVNTEPAARAAAYIEEELGGLEVERLRVGHVEVPPMMAGPFALTEPGAVDVTDDNLLVRFGGEGQPALLLMAHYDSVPGSPGAVDNAASVGILLEIARALAARPPPRPVLLAFTASEEVGLAGARALAPRLLARRPSIGLAVSLDLVGAAPSVLNGLSPHIGRGWLRWIAARLEESGADLAVPVPHRVASRLAPRAERSDHGAFTERGVPAFHLYGRGDQRIYLAYHTRWDTAEQIDPDVIDETARFVMAMARSNQAFPSAGGDPGTWLPGTSIILPAALVQGVEAALAAATLFLLFFMWRRGGARARGPGIGLGALLLLMMALWFVAYQVLDLAAGDHPRPWVHRPLFSTVLAVGVVATGAALAWLSPLGRRPLVGRRRHAAAAMLPLLLAGVGMLALGGHELAGLPLTSAVLVGAAAFAPGRALPLLLLALSLVPLFPALSPAFLREALFNGVYPPGLPLPFFLAILLTPHAIAAVPLLARALPARAALPRWAAAVPAVLLVSLVVAAVVSSRQAPCDPDSFARLGLACEIAGE